MHKIYLFIISFIFALSCRERAAGPVPPPEINPSPVLSTKEFPFGNPFPYLNQTPLADGFQIPVGPPKGRGYYNAQPFGGPNYHLGDDWNGTGGGNTDLGLPIFASAHGVVFFAQDIYGGWGNVIRIVHQISEEGKSRYFESLYAHCDTLLVREGDRVARGQQIGTIGNAHGIYAAHLHFEIRDSLGMDIGGGYSPDTAGYRNPTRFLSVYKP